ncbi:MAG: tetratricopeptide repeat protein [Bacteroidales bacterium]|nr:tetratricopeptide repeat protein [Bacteroidales bacterium]
MATLTPAEVVEKAGALFDGNKYRETIEVIDEELPSLRAAGDPDNLAECLSMLAISYFRLGDYPSAFATQNECYELDLASGDVGNISSSLNTLAGICLAMENYEEGERLIREAIRYEETLGPSAALAVRYGMASDILLKEEKVDEAIEFAEKALELDSSAGRQVQTAIRRSQLAAAYIDAGRLNEADKLLEAASETFDTIHDLHSLAVCRHQQGMIAAKRGNFRRSANFLREGLTLSRQTGELLLQRNLSQDLAVVLKDIDPRSAIALMQDVVVLSDSLYRQEMSRTIAELAVKNDLSDKEREIAAQQAALKSRHRQLVLLGVQVLLLLALAAFFLWRLLSLRKKYALLEEASEMKDKLLALGTSPETDTSDDEQDLYRALKNLGAEPANMLTTREREIAILCSKEMSNKEIAGALNLSPRTVETHKNNIFRKLGINSSAELIEIMKQGQKSS